MALAAPAAVAGTVSPSSTDARAIMEAADDRDLGEKMTGKTDMVIIDSTGRKRTLSFRASAIELRAKGKRTATKALFQFTAPADVRNTGLLTVAYEDPSVDDPQWIFLPRMRKSKRVAGNEKTNAWVGSDYSYSDLSRQDPDDYDFKLLQKSVKVDGEDCWLIEAVPRTERARTDTGYVKAHWWVSKEKIMPIQGKAWVRKGQKIKLFKAESIKKVDGVWIAHKSAARTMVGKKVESTTLVNLSDVKIKGATVSEASFSVANMERGL